jgi:hypothetical protein
MDTKKRQKSTNLGKGKYMQKTTQPLANLTKKQK